MSKNPNATIEVWGDFALWTRPESKVERMTYAVPSPGAIRGLLSSIYSKPPEFYWQVQRIEVLSPIRYISFKRNEVKSKMMKIPQANTRKAFCRMSVIGLRQKLCPGLHMAMRREI